MKKIELLAPAGSMESLKAAVAAGCDAIYCGGRGFGARAFANNFSYEQMKEAVAYCHLRNVKVYVTVNTLIHEDKMEDCLAYVDELVQCHVDALLVQDFGLMSILRQRYPDLELHASTQMHAHNVESVQFLKEQGMTRVVVARETPLAIIEKSCTWGVEIEAFVHGALCVSYSGECLMSAILKNRSGNQGECAQLCRMKYDLVDDTNHKYNDEAYLLSLKDLNSVENVDKLIKAGVSSLKIEGRMKRPEYVYLVVSIYRKAIDMAYEGKHFVLDDKTLNELKKVFNRGFTEGFLMNTDSKSISNHHRPNHLGVPVGKVISAKRNMITVSLTDNLYQNDGIRILKDREDIGFIVNKLYYKGKLVNHGEKNQVVDIECKDYVDKGALVLKTTDKPLMDDINRRMSSKHINDVHIRFTAFLNSPLTITVTQNDLSYTAVSSEIFQQAQKSAVTKERLIEQISKINDTCFTLGSIDGEIEGNLFISMKGVNETKRIAMAEFEKLKSTEKSLSKHDYIPYDLSDIHSIDEDIIIVQKEEQKTESGIVFSETQKVKADGFAGYRANEKNIYPHCDLLIANSVGDIRENNWIAGNGLNITNAYAAAFFYHHHAKAVIVSNEVSLEQKQQIEQHLVSWGYQSHLHQFAYGKRDMMVMKYCPVNAILSDGKKQKCGLCHQKKYYLRDLQNHKYHLEGDDLCIMHIYEEYPYRNDEIDTHRVLRFTDETADEVNEIMESFQWK